MAGPSQNWHGLADLTAKASRPRASTETAAKPPVCADSGELTPEHPIDEQKLPQSAKSAAHLCRFCRLSQGCKSRSGKTSRTTSLTCSGKRPAGEETSSCKVSGGDLTDFSAGGFARSRDLAICDRKPSNGNSLNQRRGSAKISPPGSTFRGPIRAEMRSIFRLRPRAWG